MAVLATGTASATAGREGKATSPIGKIDLTIDTSKIKASQVANLYELNELEEIWIRGDAEAIPADFFSELKFVRTERASTYVGLEIPEYAVWIKK